jgi:ketosteroid isomerase-like protein
MLKRVALLLTGWQLAGCAHPRSASGEEAADVRTSLVDEEVRARLAVAYADMEAGDLDRVMRMYAPDALIQSAGQAALSGVDCIRQFWSETFAKYAVRLVPTVEEARQAGGLVFVRGRAIGLFVPRGGGAALETQVWFHQVYLRGADGELLFWRGANGPLLR